MENTKKCPYCGEEIKAVAKKCKFCGEWLDEKSKNSANTGTVQNVDNTDDSSNGNGKKRLNMSYGFVLPLFFTLIFSVGLIIFHTNYSYTDWWIDEENIIIPAIGVFAILIAGYFFIIWKKNILFKQRSNSISFLPHSSLSRKHILYGFAVVVVIGIAALITLNGGSPKSGSGNLKQFFYDNRFYSVKTAKLFDNSDFSNRLIALIGPDAYNDLKTRKSGVIGILQRKNYSEPTRYGMSFSNITDYVTVIFVIYDVPTDNLSYIRCQSGWKDGEYIDYKQEKNNPSIVNEFITRKNHYSNMCD